MKKKEIEQILNTYYTDKSLNKSVASELFDLSGVSQQRELLIASKETLKYLEKQNIHNMSAWTIIDTLKKAINCG